LVRSDNSPFQEIIDIAKTFHREALNIGQSIDGHQYSTFHDSSNPLPPHIEVYACSGFDEFMEGKILANLFSREKLRVME